MQATCRETGPSAIVPSDTFALTTTGLKKDFRGFVAVNGVDLKVRRHGIHALIGPNGAGKTTLFNLLTKFLSPSAGTICYEGIDISDFEPARIARLGIVRSFQISSTFPLLSALDNVRVSLQRRHKLQSQFWLSRDCLSRLDDEAHDLLTLVGLQDSSEVEAGDLSYGRKRALEMATTLALDPKMLLLDEPTAGMGHEDIDKITRMIAQVCRDRTVLMVEHNLKVVAELADHITVLSRGQVLTEGTYDEVSRDPRVVEAYIGIDDEC